MRQPRQAIVFALCLIAPLVSLPGSLAAQQPAEQNAPDVDRVPVSVERIKEGLQKKGTRLKVDVQPTVATFRSSVEREYMPSFKEQLRKEFELTTLQRQSQDWASKGRGLNLVQLAKGVRSAYRDYQARRIQEEVTRERLQVEAASRQ